MNQPVDTYWSSTPLEPRKIIIEETGTQVAYACRLCGMLSIFGAHDTDEDKERKREEASMHCVRNCPCGNGKPLEMYSLRCKECCAKLEEKRERALFDASEKLTIETYSGPVFWRGHEGDFGTDYFSEVDALLDYCERRRLDLPDYVWTCVRHDFSLDVDGILQDAIEGQNMDPERVCIPKEAVGRLQAFIDVWLKEQAVVSWFQDEKRSVVLREDAPPSAA